MGVERESTKISYLRLKVEQTYGKKPIVHSDFIKLGVNIERKLRQHISETTLERVWGYSVRGYATVSLHTLNMLSRYAGYDSWTHFCESLKEEGFKDSDMFDEDFVRSEDLLPGDCIELQWLPDRRCIIRYLGENRFEAIESENATIQSGDTFKCQMFALHQPAVMDHFIAAADPDASPKRYVAGVKHGISSLKIL